MTFTTSLRRQTALVLGLLTLAGPAVAQSRSNLVDLSVVNRDTGELLHTWYHDGRLHVAGEVGTRYGLRFSNHTGHRVLAVVSVDGVNIITGETANYNERGYVLSPWQTIDVNGWRKSETAIADFQFSPLSGSYAARTDRPGDVGVIGMAVFQERTPQPPIASTADSPPPNIALGEPFIPPRLRAPTPASATPAPLARAVPAPVTAAPPPPAAALSSPPVMPAPRSALGDLARPSIALEDEKLGTAHGASEWSVINTVNFVRATNEPQAISAIEYDTWDHLVASGVIPRNAGHHPQAFPGEPRLSYVPDPPA